MRFFSLALLATLTVALRPGDPDYDCQTQSIGTICQPRNDSPARPIGDHINLDLLATGIRTPIINSTGISVALLERKTGRFTQLTWNQRDAEGIDDGTQYFKILTSHNGGIVDGDVTPAFYGEGQLPCSLFDHNPGGQAEFEWLLTHYYGEHCTYNNTKACLPLLINIPPLEGSRSILLKDNAEVCGR